MWDEVLRLRCLSWVRMKVQAGWLVGWMGGGSWKNSLMDKVWARVSKGKADVEQSISISTASSSFMLDHTRARKFSLLNLILIGNWKISSFFVLSALCLLNFPVCNYVLCMTWASKFLLFRFDGFSFTSSASFPSSSESRPNYNTLII